MKKIIMSLAGIIPMALMAQTIKIDRSKAPQPAPAPVISIAQPTIFTLANGLKVYVVQNNKLPRVTASLSLNIEPFIEGEKAGTSSLAGSLLRRGTVKKSKAVLDEEIDFLGGSVGSSATSVSANALVNNFDKVFQLMAEVALQPAFDEKELEKVRKQTLSGLQSAKDDPDAISENVLKAIVYGKNHPYGDIETEKTVSSITIADVKKFYNTYWKPNVGYLVFVGDITPAKAKTLAETHFGKWAKGTLPAGKIPTVSQPAKNIVAIVDRPASVQSSLQFVAPIQLAPGAPDDIPTDVMGNILGGGFSGRLFANLREKYAFTYGAYSDVNTDRYVGTFNASASVRNEKTDSAIGQFFVEFERLRNEAIPADELSRMKNYLSGGFARSLEQPSTIANFALRTAINNLPADYYQKYLTNLAAVNSQAVQAMAKKYIPTKNMYIIIVGNAKEISKGLEKYGEIKYFNTDGQEVAAPTTKTLDPSITGKAIIEKAIQAYGGEAAYNALKDVTMEANVAVMGQNIPLVNKYVFPGTYSNELKMGAMILQKELLNNGVYKKIQQGQEAPLTDDDKAEMDENAALVSEIYHVKNNAQFTVKGIEAVEGEDAYEVEITPTKGKKSSAYYSVKTGLKLKTASKMETPRGELVISTFYKDYKNYGGILLPSAMTIDQGGFKLEMTFTKIEVNTGLKAADVQ